MVTYFISDLHLDPSQPTITHFFFRFLTELAPKVDALYILGDLFEAWIGDDNCDEFNSSIVQALKQISSKIPVYCMRGNRDFLIGNEFATKTGCQLLADPSVIELYGNRVLLMHGNTLCTLDQKHLRYYAFVTKPWVQRLFLLFPLSLRRKIANSLRAQSKHHTRSLSDYMMDVTPAEVIRIMEQYKVLQLIHGHTHRPATHEVFVNGESAQRIVLGAWHQKPYILAYNHDKSLQVIEEI